MNYETIVSALELRYGTQYLKQVYRSQLKVRVQGSNESVQEYGADVEKMARLAWPEAPEEFLHQFTIQCFLDGLRDVDLRQTLQLERGSYQVLKDAIVAALEYEAAKNVSRQVRGIAEVEEGNLNTLPQVLAAQFEKYLGPIADSLNQKRPGRPKCYYCGLVGHLQRDCRQRIRAEDRKSTGRPFPSELRSPRFSISTIRRSRDNSDADELPNSHRAERSHENTYNLSRRPCEECNCRFCGSQEERGGQIRQLKTIECGSNEKDLTKENLQAEQKKDPELKLVLEPTKDPDLKLDREQRKDPDLKIVREWLDSGARPQWQEIAKYGEAVKGYWLQWDSLCLRDDVITRKWESPDGKRTVPQVVLPRSCVKDVLAELHDSRSGGHFGINRTLARVRERYYWVNCRQDVEEWCKRCDLCASKKGPKTRLRGKLKQYITGTPWERVAVDILGPFPVTTSGNKYLMVAMDYFSKWPEVAALPNQEAVTVGEALLENVVSRHGVPLLLHSDQGRNFESEVWKTMMALLGIKKTRTTPLHPQSDGMVERHNRTINNYLSLFVHENQRDWDKLVPLFLLAYRSSQHDATGYTPAMLLTGREMKLPIDLLHGNLPDEEAERETLPEYVSGLKDRLVKVHDFARNKLQLTSDRMKVRFDQKSTPVSFKEGDAVWLYQPTRRKGLSPKLQRPWEGPYMVTKKINDLVYRVQLTPRSKPKVVHLERLCRYEGQNPPTWSI